MTDYRKPDAYWPPQFAENDGYYIKALIAERDKLTEEVERQVELIAHMSLDEEKLFKRVSELEVALKQIADPLLSPLLSRRDIARAALSRTSEEA
jgi:hypothetical protein